MVKIVRYLPLVVVLLISVALQFFFVLADKHDVPNGAAAEFSKAYFQLDECTMSKYICKSAKSDGAISDYMYQVASNASARGFETSYLKSRISHIETRVVENDGTHAVVALTAKKIKSINPVFEAVGRIFCLIKPTDVHQTMDLIKEDGEWKVCGDILHMS